MKQRSFGSVRRLPSGHWQARYVGPDTRRHTAPHTFKTERFARRWLDNEEDLIERDSWAPPASRTAREKIAGVTVDQYVERIIQRRATRARRPLAPTTVDLYRKDYRLRIAQPLGGVLLAELDEPRIALWWDTMDKATPTQNGRAYDLLKSILADAVRDKLIRENPCQIRGAGKPDPKRRGEALTIDEVQRYLAAVPERYRLPLMISAWCGLRSGEVRGLRRRDIDLGAQTIRVEQAVSRVRTGPKTFEWRYDDPKTDAGRRTVSMPAMMVEPVRTWLANAPLTGADGLVFTGGNLREPLQSSVLWEAHAKGKRSIGREQLTVHDLRRTAATLAAQDGATVSELMRLLGHTTVTMAMVYQVATDQRDRERAARLDERLRVAAVGRG